MEISTHLGSSMGLAGEGPAKVLLPGADQEYIFCSPEEFGQSGVLLSWDGTNGCDGKSIIWGVHWVWSGREELACQES